MIRRPPAERAARAAEEAVGGYADGGGGGGRGEEAAGRQGGRRRRLAEDDEEEELSDEEAIAAREAEKEFELPPEMMPTITFGEFVPLRVGRNLPPPRFGHAMCLAGSTAYVFGGRNKSISAPVLHDFHKFDAAPLVWKEIAYDGDGPGTRVSHTMVQLEHYLYVLGGGSGNRAFNDLHRLDLFTMHWELIHTQGAVPAPSPARPHRPLGRVGRPLSRRLRGRRRRRPSNDLHTPSCARPRGVPSRRRAPPAPASVIRRRSSTRPCTSSAASPRASTFTTCTCSTWKAAVEPADCERQGATAASHTRPRTTRGHPPLWRLGRRHVLQRLLCLLAGGSTARVAAAGGGSPGPRLPGAAGGGILKGGALQGGKAAAGGGQAGDSEGLVWCLAPAEVAGFAPEPRYSHSATAIGHLLFIVGGCRRRGSPSTICTCLT